MEYCRTVSVDQHTNLEDTDGLFNISSTYTFQGEDAPEDRDSP